MYFHNKTWYTCAGWHQTGIFSNCFFFLAETKYVCETKMHSVATKSMAILNIKVDVKITMCHFLKEFY